MKEEIGVMVVKDGKAWGNIISDGQITLDGWVDIENAQIRDSKYCHNPTDFTWEGSKEAKELLKGRLVKVKRTTKVELLL